MLNLIIFGPPGAGKGTQSEKLLSKYQLQHISTGDLLRAERNAGTELGNQANEFIAKGELVPDAVVIGMVKNFMLAHTGISIVLGLEVNEDELVKRLLLRGQSSGRADDQDESTIRNRFQEYQNKTLPLQGYYQAQGKYHGVMGIGEVEDIFGSLCAHIDAL